jgi:uncharacterized membrane protein YkgB
MNKTITVIIIFIIATSLNFSNFEAKKIEKTDLPSYFSWRNINNTDYTTSIKNQAPAPTCEAYALCASMETLIQYQMKELFNPDLSETHLYFYAGGTYEAGYVNLIDAANYLINHGVPDEGCYPDPHRPYDYAYNSIEGWENRTVKITEWGWIEQTEESIKTALIEHGPLIICAWFWKDFYYYKSGVYRHRWGKLAGGHVMCMVGYDDNERCWIVKNSAGTNWGEEGWLKMSYDADMFADWYGEGTGVMYIDGIYGNLKPKVPKIKINKPDNFKTYFIGIEIKTIIHDLPTIQKASPRIIGDIIIEVSVENTDFVEFYIDNIKQYTDDNPPFSWNLQTTNGMHTLEVRAIKDNIISKDVVDLYKIL